MPTLTRANFLTEVCRFLACLKELRIPPLNTQQPLELFRELKRGKLKAGPYENCSIFEVANRVMSDLVVFAAVEALLLETPADLAPAPPDAVEPSLGVQDGWDLEATLKDGRTLLGECFNVAPSFFPTKFRNSVKALEGEASAVRLIAFNADAVAQLERLTKRKKPWLHLLPVDTSSRLEVWKQWL